MDLSDIKNESVREKIKKRFNQLKTLNKTGATDEELWNQAKDAINEKLKLDEINIESFFPTKIEQKQARELLRKYVRDYTIETVSDKNTLCQLIYLEILNTRLQDTINKTFKDTKGISTTHVDLIHKNVEKISDIKETLGITKEKKQQSTKDGFSYLELIKKKYKRWLEENQGSRHLTCPHCGKMTLLRIKMDAWEAQKHPFFKDRILGNDHLILLFKENKLSREDLAKIFEVSPDYVSWLIERGWGLKFSEDQERLNKDEKANSEKESGQES